MRRPAEALKESQEGVKIIQNLADANPGVPQFQKDLGFGLSAMGRLHAQEKQFTEAFVALDRALAMLQKLADAHPTYSDYTLRLASGHFDRGWAHLHAGHPAQAAADLRRSVALSEKAARNDQLVERSRALALLAAGWRREVRRDAGRGRDVRGQGRRLPFAEAPSRPVGAR